MSLPVRALAAAIGLLLLAGAVAVLAVPLYGVREDTLSTERLIAAQLETARSQLVVLETSLEVQRDGVEEARRTRALTEELLATARTTLDTAQRTLAVTERISEDTRQAVGLLREQLALTRELLAVARQTLQEVRQINRKTGSPPPAAPALP